MPPAQSELMYEALRHRGVPVAYLSFEGEQHGFRQAATIVAVAQAELAFYGRVLGFAPDRGATPDARHRQRGEDQSSSVMACLGQRCTASTTFARSSSGGFSCSTYRKSSSRTSKTSGAAAMHRALLSHKS